jgi:hypothetical protein
MRPKPIRIEDHYEALEPGLPARSAGPWRLEGLDAPLRRCTAASLAGLRIRIAPDRTVS